MFFFFYTHKCISCLLSTEALANALQSVGGIRRENRDCIHRLVGELRNVAKGRYPYALPEEVVDGDLDVSEGEEEKAVERLEACFSQYLIFLFFFFYCSHADCKNDVVYSLKICVP